MLVVPIEKNEDKELPVPTFWRESLKNLADSFVTGVQFTPVNKISLEPIDEKTTKICIENIEDYPDIIGQLSEKTWRTSVYIWMGDHWKVLVDLSMSDGNTSDLVMHTKIRENGDSFYIDLYLIYVP